MGHFGSHNIYILKLFSRSVDEVFLKFYLMTGIYKNIEVTALILKENSYSAQYRRNVPFLDSKSILFNLCLNLLIRFFLNYN